MKNKKFMYGLILSVAAVWGIIFYRVFTATVAEETPAYTQNMSFSKISLTDYGVKDTSALALNYRDPFSEKVPQEEAKPLIPAIAKVNIRVQPVLNRDYVKYGGYITNPITKKIVSILTINGKEQMMSEGNVSGDVQLVRNYKDSVSIIYKDKTYFIRKN